MQDFAGKSIILIISTRMLANFARGSSKVDWCETNYEFVSFIAEFFNTISNVIFLLFPPFLMYLYRPYSKHVDAGVNVVWMLMVVIGISSAYFHATLSLVGQLLDEVAILWVLMTAFALWTPKWLLQFGPFRGDRGKFKCILAAAAFTLTWLGFVYPVANAFVLLLAGFPLVLMLFAQLKRCSNQKIIRLGYICTIWWVLATGCWLSDRLFCSIWKSLSFPYVHCCWHILIFIASYTGCVLGAYFYAVSDYPELKPKISYWPESLYEWGLPYVAVTCKSGKDLQA